MRTWKYNLRFKHLLSASDDQNLAFEVGVTISQKLEGLLHKHPELWDCTSEDLVLQLDSVNPTAIWEALCEEESGWIELPPIVELNEALTELYDWCDNNDVFCD